MKRQLSDTTKRKIKAGQAKIRADKYENRKQFIDDSRVKRPVWNPNAEREPDNAKD